MYQSDISVLKSQIFNGSLFIDATSYLRGLAGFFQENGIVVELCSEIEKIGVCDRPDRIGCLLFDAASTAKRQICLPLLRGLQPAAHRINAIVVVDPSDFSLAVRAMRAGAFDVLDITVDHTQLLSRVQQALGALGSAPPTHDATGSFGWKVDADAAHAALATLTGRQREILDRIVLGQANKIIAADLGIKLRTAENHRAAIMKKMGASSVSRLIQIALAARTDPSRLGDGNREDGSFDPEGGIPRSCPPAARP